MDRLKYCFRQEAGSGTLELYIYSDVCSDYYDLDENWNLIKVTSETSADYFRRQLEEHTGVTQINLYINSMGGSVLEGYGIYSQLKRHPAKKTCYVDGFACSIASIIACAAQQVIVYPNSMMMIHNMVDCVCGNADQLREAAAALDKIMEGNRQVYIDKSGGKLSEAELLTMLKAETWLTAQDCIRYGLADELKASGGMNAQSTATLMEQSNNDLKRQIARRALLMQTAKSIGEVKPMPDGGNPPGEPTPMNPEERTLAALFSSFGRKAQ